MAELPPLPTIVGEDLLLDIYTHKSLIPSGAPMNEEYGDTDRLADLGARVLDLAVTFHLHSKRPMLSALEVDQQRAQAITDENIEHWLTVYGIRQKLRFAPSESASVGSPNELRRFFHTYIGAVQIRNGMHTIQRWISQLVDPDIDVESLVDVFGPPRHHASGQDRVAPPPPCSPPSLPLPRSSHVTSESVFALVTLALVNETAAKKKVAVGYLDTVDGEAHIPTWTVICYMDGTERGHGVGGSKKVAKENAARQAWVSMGWGLDDDGE